MGHCISSNAIKPLETEDDAFVEISYGSSDLERDNERIREQSIRNIRFRSSYINISKSFYIDA